MPSAGQKRLSRWAPRQARSLKNCVCALQESPPRPLRLVPSTPARTLTSHIAVRLGPRRPIYVPGLARAGREHRSKRCATWACRWGLDQGMRPRCRQQLLSAGVLGPTCWAPVIGIGTGMGGPPMGVPMPIIGPQLVLEHVANYAPYPPQTLVHAHDTVAAENFLMRILRAGGAMATR